MIRVDDMIVGQYHFPDGTLHLELPNSPCITNKNWVKIKWNYENDAELFTLICVRKHYQKYKAVLIMPYIPHARMDRVKERYDVFTLKYFCEVINSLNFEEVYVLDAHSNVSLALLDRVKNLDVEDYIKDAITHCEEEHGDNIALFFPDEGAMKRYSSMSNNLPFAFGIKNRDWKTGKILGLTLQQKENIVGKNVLIIDDICSRGGTFYYSAKALIEAGAKSVSLYITHCENTILEGEVFSSDLIDKVYTTNSLVHKTELRKKVKYMCEEEEDYDI